MKEKSIVRRRRKFYLLRRFLNKWLAVLVFLFLQAAFLTYVLVSGSRTSELIGTVLSAISFLAALWIISRKGENAYKFVWVFWILVFPIFGGLFYIVLNARLSRKSFVKRARKSEERIKPLLPYPAEDVLDTSALSASLGELSHPRLTELKYLTDYVKFPAYHNTETQFLPSGEAMFRRLCEELEKAEKYIFLEYFILEEGIMWDTILEILERKVKEGVLVRVIYDDLGCFLHLPKRYYKTLRKKGIETAVFNPFVSVLTVEQNNRDHRKIAVVDGKTAFTGGINLADEYINVSQKIGHWNDAAILVRGSAAWSLTLIFLQMWELCCRKSEDIASFHPIPSDAPLQKECGVVLPYADSPLDEENVGEQVYLGMIGRARKYVYITTPYLIIDDKIAGALELAAKSGVDVRIITPKKWDKRLVHAVTRSYYASLTACGVRIYEYTPGFIHAKTIVSDDEVAVVGSINFDYRSFYLHFECGVLVCGNKCVTDVRDNFLSILEKCEEIPTSTAKEGFFKRIKNAFLYLLAPLF